MRSGRSVAAILLGLTALGLQVAAPAPAGARAATTSAAAQRPAHGCSASHWVATWAAAPSDGGDLITPTLQTPDTVADQTFRMIVPVHRGGATIRVRLTNRFGEQSVTFGHVTVAVQSSGAAIEPKTLRAVTFSARSSVTVPSGADVFSDPIALRIAPFEHLAISMYVPGSTVMPTEHFVANETSYLTADAAGDHAGDTSAPAFTQATTSWYFVDGLDVRAAGDVGSVVAFGDSITDGWIASGAAPLPENSAAIDTDSRYTDFLQRRIDAAALPYSVVDEGIAGNRVLANGLVPMYGPSGVSRVETDAAGQSGVTDAIILEGINDLGSPNPPDAATLEAGLVQLVSVLQSAHVHVLLGTIMPASNAVVDGTVTAPASETTREAVNTWIRGQHLSDGVVDFASAMADPSDPTVLNPVYAGPGNLHPNVAGYEAMAAAVDLAALTPAC